MHIVIDSGSTAKRFHCTFEWHLTPQMTLSIETCITVLSGRYSIPGGCHCISILTICQRSPLSSRSLYLSVNCGIFSAIVAV